MAPAAPCVWAATATRRSVGSSTKGRTASCTSTTIGLSASSPPPTPPAANSTPALMERCRVEPPSMTATRSSPHSATSARKLSTRDGSTGTTTRRIHAASHTALSVK